MKLDDVVPMLTVTDLRAAIAFYRDLLGFSCISEAEGWVCLEKDGVQLMFALPNRHVAFDKSYFTGSLYFKTDDVDGLWGTVKDKATIVYPIENFDYGMREFAIRDNNGYLLQFGKEVE